MNPFGIDAMTRNVADFANFGVALLNPFEHGKP
jgi:toxin FitB